MRILVAGWHGQIALALSEAAVRRPDVTSYAVGRTALDLSDRPAVGRTLLGTGPDIIISTAAYTDVDGAEREPALAFRRNAEGPGALAAQAARRGVPIIHLSTVYVFDGHQSRPYCESDKPSPLNAYGRSKLAGEHAVAAANPRHIILRTGWIYSPFSANFVTNLYARARTARHIEVDALQRGSPTYAPNLAAAILDIARSVTAGPQSASPDDSASVWGTYHIADDGEARWCDIARATLAADVGRPSPPPVVSESIRTPTAQQAPRPVNATLQTSALARTFNIRLPSWRQAIHDCVGRLAQP